MSLTQNYEPGFLLPNIFLNKPRGDWKVVGSNLGMLLSLEEGVQVEESHSEHNKIILKINKN